MSTSLTSWLLHALYTGVRRSHPDLICRLRSFLHAHILPAGGFADRHGNPDLYYTMYGLMLTNALQEEIDEESQLRFLLQIDANQLDLVHLACLARAHYLLQHNLPPTEFIRWLQTTGTNFAVYPHNDPAAPYSQFLLWSLASDIGVSFPLHSLRRYRLPDGLFANLPGEQSSTTNASAAAIMLLQERNPTQLAKWLGDVYLLADLQHPDGGFPATPQTPMPDLLSTATASLALIACFLHPNYSLKPFLRKVITASGGFAAMPGEQVADLEYTTYGLMAMGMTS